LCREHILALGIRHHRAESLDPGGRMRHS
jgi:hypothetical protein